MHRNFDYFIILAEMCMDSNLLESKLATLADFKTFAEEFNPYFVGSPKTRHIMDVQLQKPISKPDAVVEEI